MSNAHRGCHCLAAALALFASVCAKGESPTFPLKDLGFEDAVKSSPWIEARHAGPVGYLVDRDVDVKTEGKQSLHIRQTAPQFFGATKQIVHAPPTGNYRLSAKLRTEDVDRRGLFFFARLIGDDNVESIARTTPIKGTNDWTRLSIEFSVAPKTKFVEIVFTLQGGGKVWVDSIEVATIKSLKNE
jgi:hypothetical protein